MKRESIFTADFYDYDDLRQPFRMARRLLWCLVHMYDNNTEGY